MPKLLALPLLFTLTLSANTQPASPKLNLQGDGHACSGSFRAAHGHLRWKSSFSLCDSAYRASSTKDGVWIFELTGKPAAASHACSMHVITVRPIDPQLEYPSWEVAGFQSLDDAHAAPPTPTLDCPMQSAERNSR